MAPLETLPTEARVRQWPSVQLPFLMVPEMLAELWLLFACQHTGTRQPCRHLPTMAGKGPWRQQLPAPPAMGTLAVPGQGAQDPSSSELAWLPLSRTMLLCPLVSSTF